MMERDEMLDLMRTEMLDAAAKLEFEKAAHLRDRVKELETMPEDRAACTSGECAVPTPPPLPGTPQDRTPTPRRIR